MTKVIDLKDRKVVKAIKNVQVEIKKFRDVFKSGGAIAR
jgi:hypothetical protein